MGFIDEILQAGHHSRFVGLYILRFCFAGGTSGKYPYPLRIAQVITNLLANGLKFTHVGGQASILLEQQDDEAVISVKDDGLGMSPENVKDLFQPFVQFESTIDRGSGGLGLGLSIVKGIVELHGGHVSAWIEGLGKGSVFTVSLPATVKN